VAYVEVLLEVVAQWEVQERAAVGGQLHRRREPTLDDGEVAGREMTVEVVHVGPQFQSLDVRQRRWVDPRASDDDHPRLGSLPLGLRERLDHPGPGVTGAARGAFAVGAALPLRLVAAAAHRER
jgi:hypothetical protein